MLDAIMRWACRLFTAAIVTVAGIGTVGAAEQGDGGVVLFGSVTVAATSLLFGFVWSATRKD